VNAALLARVLRERRRLRSRQRWSRARLESFQAQRLAELRRWAYARSPFYRRFHRGLESRPLAELPVLTKSEVMGQFDQLATAPQVRLAEVERYLAHLDSDQRLAGRFWVSRTSGSTGHPGIFVVDAREWATVIASYARAQEWAGIVAGPTRRTRLAIVSSRAPWHQSARVGMSVRNPLVPVRSFDATEPLDAIVAGLNGWQPETLVAYASMARALAGEQLAGRLRIAPRAVMCSSEVLTAEAAARIERAWGSRPWNVYAATEAAGIASECRLHSMHLYEDLVIVEVVDERHRPVPPDRAGEKLLVTVLWSRTQPLIRYEMSDCVSLSTATCSCGLPFRLLAGIEGRSEDSLTMPASAGGETVVHPNLFHRLLEPLPVEEYQVVQEADRLRILLARPARPIEREALAAAVARALRESGAEAPPIEVEIVEAVPRSRLGKAPLVKALRAAV
jgi:putative adenylate-forming enzyme